MDPEDVDAVNAQFDTEDQEVDEFLQILSHEWKNGTLHLRVLYESGDTITVSYSTLKKDVPLELAKYIWKNVLEARRNGFYSRWAKNIIKNHERIVR